MLHCNIKRVFKDTVSKTAIHSFRPSNTHQGLGCQNLLRFI